MNAPKIEQSDVFEQRLLVPPQYFDTGISGVHIDPGLKATYSDMVEASFAEQIQRLAPLDVIAPFSERAANPELAYDLYRNVLEAPYPGYWDTVDTLAQSVDPISAGRIATSVMCVATEQEAGHLPLTLEQHAIQEIAEESKYELFLFLNSRGTNPAAEQQTLAEIDRFQIAHPNVDIKATRVLLQNEKLSDIKKMASDIALVRWATASEIDRRNYIMLLNDADTAYQHPLYVNDYAKLFSKNTEVDIAMHLQDMDHRAFHALGPDFTFGARVRQLIERHMARNSGFLFPEGFDTAVRTPIYAAAGGFAPGKPFGVDYTFGKVLHYYRGGDHTLSIARPEEVGIQTSARRPAYSHLKGIQSGVNTRSDEVINTTLRTQGYPLLENELPITEQLQAESNRIHDYLANIGVPRDHPQIREVFRYFGVEAEPSPDGELTITDATLFLNAYQKVFRS